MVCGSQGLIMSPPETRYAKAGDVSIAFQVSGSGPFDLIFVPGFVSNLDVQWETPGYLDLFARFGRFSRLIRFDKRGTGLSDRVSGIPNLDERMDDVRAVMDAVGSSRAALFGLSEGGPMSLLCRHLSRTRSRPYSVWQLCASPDAYRQGGPAAQY